MNDTLQNGDIGSGIGLLKSHTLPKDKESSKLNEMNIIFDNGDVNGDYCYMNSYTGSESNNHIKLIRQIKYMKFLLTDI